METTRIPVDGMTCQGCVNSLTRALQGTPGVKSATVTLTPAQASIEHDPAIAPADRLRSVIADAGFEAR
ncbi:MAG: heavy-metal-associated domain-containing protein [bacterium]|jgi:copper chaperone CopZ|nr:heavy-metal-associated domain-containing protein [Betaproteobacteria bacterium]